MTPRIGESREDFKQRRAQYDAQYAKETGRYLLPPVQAFGLAKHPGRIDLEIENGIGLVGSDAHIWPGDPTPAMRAFLMVTTMLSSDLSFICLNGDVIDCSAISRYPSIGWETKPTVAEELGAGQTQLREIRRIGGPDVDYFWTLGNHDGRFETRIATLTPELAGIHGVHLKDHFPDWEPCWSLWANNSVCIKHRFRNGIHAVYNNTLHSGVTMVTGHLHSLKVIPFTDYHTTRFGVDTGTLATPYSPQFVHYTEANPVNWRAGGAVLTWYNGHLLWPELFHVMDEHHFEFRGKVYEI